MRRCWQRCRGSCLRTWLRNFYAYSAYGETAVLGPDGGNSLQYTGRENDGTGQQFNRGRYYDPVLKRWLNEDPIGIAGGLNLYAYAANNPTSFRDPFGLDVTITFFPGFPGHIGIGVNTLETQGHYPNTRAGAILRNGLSVCYASTPGRVVKDRERQGDSEYKRASILVIPTTPAQDRNIQKHLDASINTELPWNVCRDQCFRYVIDALGAAGISVPDYGTTVPRTLFNELQQRYGSANWP